MSGQASSERGKRRTLLLLGGLALGMFGFGFAMVPLYGLLCQVTGVQSVDQRVAIGTGAATGGAGGISAAQETSTSPGMGWSHVSSLSSYAHAA